MVQTMSTRSLEALMKPLGSFPLLGERDSLKLALDLMTKHRLGISCFVDSENQLIAVLSDGDLRRLLLSHQSPLPALLVSDAIEFAQKNPTSISVSSDINHARELMRPREVSDLPVISPTKGLIGLLHIHDID